ncbi:hypothetical protein C5C50_00970 [Rathayibacter sp. AY1D9]|nr:hypothetical protein C5C50_00970 [Rathayibacter sp. AY1D9]
MLIVPMLTVAITEEPGAAFDVEIDAEFDPESLRYRARALRIASEDVTGAMLRTVRVLDYLRIASRQGIFVQTEDPEESPPVSIAHWIGSRETLPLRFKEESPALSLRYVAFVYLLASAASEPPAKAVERDLKVSPRTATNRIRAAREAGMLDWKVQLLSTGLSRQTERDGG